MLLLYQSSFVHQIGTWMCQVHQQVQGIQQQKDRWRQRRPKLRQLQALKSLPPQLPLTAATVPPAPTPPTHHHPRPCPLSLSQVLSWPTVPSGFSVILSPLRMWWDLPASGMSLPLHFSSACNIYHLQCCILHYRLCLPSLVEYQLHTGGVGLVFSLMFLKHLELGK